MDGCMDGCKDGWIGDDDFGGGKRKEGERLWP